MSLRRHPLQARLATALVVAFLLANASLVLHDYVLSAHLGQDSCEICLVGGAHGAALIPTPALPPLPVATSTPATSPAAALLSLEIRPYAARAPPYVSSAV